MKGLAQQQPRLKVAYRNSVRSFSALLLFIVFFGTGFAQNEETGTITGFLYDSETHQPLGSANIYLSKTTLGTTSDPTGYFELKNIPTGKYILICSFLGYKTKQYSLEIKNQAFIDLKDVMMEADPIELSRIDVISSKPKEWLRNLDYFQLVFLGTSDNASKTEIVNPEVLEFTKDPKSGNLTASNPEELHIVNHSLGYELFVMISSFSWDTGNEEGKFFYTARINELEPASIKQQQDWEKNRSRTYRGSLRQFLQLLVENNVEKQFRLLNGNIEFVAEGSGRFDGTYIYKVNSHDGKSLQVEHRRRNQSEIRMHEDRWLYLDEYGNLVNPETMVLSGYWSTQRVADFLPFNYRE